MQFDFQTERVKTISERFKTIEKLGGGTYGVVQKCVDLETKQIVALKQIIILNPDDGFPHNTIREVDLLQELQHDNIILLKFVVQSEKEPGLYLVFEYCEYDLYALLYMPDSPKMDQMLTLSLMKQFIVALHFCAIHKVVHRDLKPANMFVTRDNVLKLGDFGLARKLSDRGRYSDKVITLWYRPPELLLKCKKYGTEIDIWSAGCILYEMVTAKALFQAKDPNELSQLQTIFGICGMPSVEDWPEFQDYEETSIFKKLPPNIPQTSQLAIHLQKNIPEQYTDIIDLLIKMLQYNPSKRITAEDALNHPFFRKLGHEYDPQNLPHPEREEMHQMDASEKKKRNKDKERERMKQTATTNDVNANNNAKVPPRPEQPQPPDII